MSPRPSFNATVEVVTDERPRAFWVEFFHALLQGGYVSDTRSRSTLYLTYGGRRASRTFLWKLNAEQLAAKIEKALETSNPADICRRYRLKQIPPAVADGRNESASGSTAVP